MGASYRPHFHSPFSRNMAADRSVRFKFNIGVMQILSVFTAVAAVRDECARIVIYQLREQVSISAERSVINFTAGYISRRARLISINTPHVYRTDSYSHTPTPTQRAFRWLWARIWLNIPFVFLLYPAGCIASILLISQYPADRPATVLLNVQPVSWLSSQCPADCPNCAC